MEIEIGRGKKARQAYGFDDIAIVPSRRTRDPRTSTSAGSSGRTCSSSRCSPRPWTGWSRRQTAIKLGELGGLGVLNLEGICTRYENADAQLEKIAKLPKAKATAGMQEIYAQPVEPKLIAQRIQEIKAKRRPRRRLADAAAGARPLRDRARRRASTSSSSRARSSPPSTSRRSASRSTSRSSSPRCRSRVIVGGCASYQTALHLMRTGAAAVLVGVGPGRGLHDARRARRRASRRRRRSPTPPPRASSTCSRPAST